MIRIRQRVNKRVVKKAGSVDNQSPLRPWFKPFIITLALAFSLAFTVQTVVPAFADLLDALFYDFTITATPLYHPTISDYTVIYNPPIKWENGNFVWAEVDGATEYMMRSSYNDYPRSTNSGELVYQGTALKTYSGSLSFSRFYTLFYKDSSDQWLVAYHQKPAGRTK